MYKRTAFYIIFAFIALVAGSCREDEVALYVDPEVQPYVDAFFEEAALHGRAIRVADHPLTIRIEQIERPNVAGQCSQSTGSDNLVIIDPVFWSGYSPLNREALIFHELGHCILERSHLDEEDANGYCISLMESGSGQCTMVYTEETRAHYLDELFSR